MALFPANATLTFSAGTGVFQTDPDTGNQVEIVGKQLVSVYLNPQSKPSTLVAPVAAIYLEGYALSPKQVTNLPCLVPVSALIGNQKGTFTLLPTLPSPFVAVTRTLGTKLTGYFIAGVGHG